MADNVGFPYCTKWKNYRYPMTQLRKNVGFLELEATGGVFGHASGERGLTIYLSDDWYLLGDAASIKYSIIMNQTGLNNECKSITRPQVFINGQSGSSTIGYDVEGGLDGWFIIGTTDNVQYLDVSSSQASVTFDAGQHILGMTAGDGDPKSLYTIVPGVHFGFAAPALGGYADDDEYGWRIEADALDNVPKIIDGTYTCWYQLPINAGDTVVTEAFPSGLTNKSFNMMWNNNRHILKRKTNAPSTGQTIYLEGSVDKENWVTITTLVDDLEINEPLNYQFQVQWDTNAVDGDDYPFKRLKFEYEVGGTPMQIQPCQYIQVNLTPN